MSSPVPVDRQVATEPARVGRPAPVVRGQVGQSWLSVLQRSAGNRAVVAVVARAESHVSVQRAGSPQRMDAPGGLAEINRQPPARLSILGPAGRTLALDDFEAPRLDITVAAADREGGGFVGRVATTNSRDAVHRSFYPGPGRHHFGAIVRNGQRYESFYGIPEAQSELIRRGEQEHLDDHRRAYDLSYGRLTTIINAMAARTFTGASEADVRAAIMTELRRRLRTAGMQSFGDPARWHDNLIALVRLSSVRDTRGWHTLQPGTPHLDGDVDITPLVRGRSFAVGRHASASVVRYAALRGGR